ncbi:MAG: DUF3800 domain-containing protein [Natronospirillum sp.]|uniref:DUF3800 domain-containing protein n=1 Tax=Natronospirillum sp. TaxID=2812955 RepID=UPI0025DEB9E8|nr:DUF3800 domain-containing protein [Natronospirillum sp.]MCH8553147.1 DUF3800 domain-containing protein [Natronospirillum sp.]
MRSTNHERMDSLVMAKESEGKRESGQLSLFEFDKENLKKVSSHKPGRKTPESDFSKYIVYVDESGDHNLQSLDESYPVFVLAFCVFHKRH